MRMKLTNCFWAVICRRHYIQLPKDNLMQLERKYMLFLERTMGQWNADVAARSTTEALLAAALSARVRKDVWQRTVLCHVVESL